MKKIQAMFAMVLVALMAFAVQSCSKSETTIDLDGDTYRMSTSMTIQEKGQMTDAEAALLEQQFDSSQTGQYITDKSAADKTAEIVDSYAITVATKMAGDKTVKFTVTIVTVNMRTNSEVCRWDVVYDKGNVTKRKY